ncbi:uncharacterized protein BYT42DRAFT_551795 [Radiomyces spectabilis]|uniref:uncharacterized protein n=1 Tax=Radiomyces spectabilis TaxID=64574 RepID=UPI00221F29A4|nr:uncharacterized protein BYT42DRAFT_551795 [Radiomyces spectabilis]KAI8393656.1 hypothetical protein BYT42DRAFT_551795 [Radiomyces spectabilis]
MHSTALILLLAAASAQALLQSPNYQYNVTQPTPNAPYVAGQKLPLIYQIAANTTADNLQLSMTLVETSNATNSVVMVPQAEIGQGFSAQKTIDGGAIVYEHQYDYNIPTTTKAGNYNAIFLDNISQTNVTVPLVIRPAPIPQPSASSAASNSGSVGPQPTRNTSIFKDQNLASSAQWNSLLCFLAIFVTSFAYLA